MTTKLLVDNNKTFLWNKAIIRFIHMRNKSSYPQLIGTIFPANIWLFTDLSKSYRALIWRVLRDNLLWHHTSFLNLQSKNKVTEQFDHGEKCF